MITYFKNKTNKSKNKYKKYKALTTLIKSFDIFVNIAATSSFITFSLKGNGLSATPISNETVYRSAIGIKVLNEKITNSKNEMKKINKQLNLLIH